VVTFKVTPVSAISTIFRSTEEEEKEERLFPQAFPNIQNRVVTKAKTLFIIGTLHLLSVQSDVFSFFFSLATPLLITRLSLYPLVFALECTALCPLCITVSSCAVPRSFFVHNDDHDV